MTSVGVKGYKDQFKAHSPGLEPIESRCTVSVTAGVNTTNQKHTGEFVDNQLK